MFVLVSHSAFMQNVLDLRNILVIHSDDHTDVDRTRRLTQENMHIVAVQPIKLQALEDEASTQVGCEVIKDHACLSFEVVLIVSITSSRECVVICHIFIG